MQTGYRIRRIPSPLVDMSSLWGGGAVSWKYSKQRCIARSTMESEFIALDLAAEEVEWLRNFLEDIPCWPKPVSPIAIHCDSMSAIGRAKNQMYTESLDIFVRDIII